jgi:transcriptional regulator with XRE-family HTH domain
MARQDTWDPLYQEIGIRIRRARENAGLSQNKLAESAKVSRTSVVNIEAGRQRLPIHQLWRIAEILEVAAGDLMPSHTELAALADGAATVQLDAVTAREIEQVAQDDPATRRLLSAFIQQAKRSMARREGARESAQSDQTVHNN